MYLGVQVHVPV